MKKQLLLLIALLGLSATPGFAAPQPAPPAVQPATLSAQDTADVERIQSYLNNLKSISADFIQISDAGQLRGGKIAIKRPGKMRVTYAAPSKDFIVADGTFVHMWDGELNQQTNVPSGEGIADLILRDNISFSGDVVLTHLTRFPAKIEISLVSAKSPGDGELTLIFEDRPLQLRQWRVLDAQGRTTGVSLENIHEGTSFPGDTFTFTPPTLGKPQKGNQ